MRQCMRRGLPLKAALLIGFSALAAGCSGSTIHIQDQVGGVDTLSVDAKQRLVFVADHPKKDGRRITCTEPMPDAIVARAAVAAGQGNFSAPVPEGAGTTNVSVGGSAGVSETAGSIGFRNETIQMLRDGYYRLCEAYMNGALSQTHYEYMITNADTFMVVVSALQTLGSNPVAPAVVINAPAVRAAASTSNPAEASSEGPKVGTNFQSISGTATPNTKSAEMANRIVVSYLNYRRDLNRQIMMADMRNARRRPVSYSH